MQATAAIEINVESPVREALRRLQSSGEMLSGAIGGPLVVGLLTPQRNAMTLAAKDSARSFVGLHRQVFASGFLAGFRGGFQPSLAAVPQFTAIGPVFLMAERACGSPAAAMIVASFTESLVTYSAQVRNARIQYNATRACASEMLAYPPLHRPMGPGFMPHVGRNVCGMMGIRLFSSHSYEAVRRIPGSDLLSEGGRLVASDLLASVFASTLSMPLNHMFSWAACTPELDRMSYLQRARASTRWLLGTYQEQGMRLLGRDLLLRANYVALLFTGYRLVERTLVDMSRQAGGC